MPSATRGPRTQARPDWEPVPTRAPGLNAPGPEGVEVIEAELSPCQSPGGTPYATIS